MRDTHANPETGKRRQRTSASAVAGFVFSLMGPLAPLGLMFSILGLFHTRDGERDGRALAVAGTVIGGLVTASLVFALLWNRAYGS